jgi:hypothetical protein
MRYLKIKRCDGIYDYVPLEASTFSFIQTDDNEYRVELSIGKRYTDTLFEKICITDVDAYMKEIADIPDGTIYDLEDLLP